MILNLRNYINTTPIYYLLQSFKTPFLNINLKFVSSKEGARGSVVVKALCYKPEGRGFETR
jgi:hypothetical protein